MVRSDGESLNQQSAVAKVSNEREYPASLSTSTPSCALLLAVLRIALHALGRQIRNAN